MKEEKMDGLTCFLSELFVARSPISGNVGRLVLESDPTPDYYAKGNFPPNKEHVSDRHLYLPIKESVACFQDIVYRKACELVDRFNSIKSVYPGQMKFQNEDHQCIRLNVSNINDLPALISEFKDLGLRFYPDKHIATYSSLIFYKKYTDFGLMYEGVYRDKQNSNRYFFEIPHNISYDELKSGIVQIKNNCDYHLFDSFHVALFYKNSVRDFIGIYSMHCDESRFMELKKQLINIFK